MEQQAEGMGSKAVAAQAVRSKAIFKLFDAVLTFPAIVIEGKDRTAAAWQVGDRKRRLLPAVECSAL